MVPDGTGRRVVSDLATRIVSEQRRRCLASILGAAEVSPWWGRLSKDEQLAYRQKVIDSLGTFYDLVRDVIKVSDEDSLRNDRVVELIERIHVQVTRR